MKKAAVFILLGQSNAVGHKLPMTEEDKIMFPLNNVFGLPRIFNQFYDNKQLTWRGYTSDGMNVAEEQDHTYSIANCLAKLWQKEIDSGTPLPDLYIIQIAVGAQGVTPGYMWNPNYEKVLIPGKLGKVKLALTPLTTNILSLVKQSIRQRGFEPEIMGIHWRGGENDFYAGAEVYYDTIKQIYQQIFNGFYQALEEKAPTILHRIVCFQRPKTEQGLKNLHYLNELFETLCAENPNMELFDVRQAPQYIPDVDGNGIFKEDFVHFTTDVNQWVATHIFNTYMQKHF